jgi:tripartite-type tricarboxylate transporter receptor subunit TctC
MASLTPDAKPNHLGPRLLASTQSGLNINRAGTPYVPHCHAAIADASCRHLGFAGWVMGIALALASPTSAAQTTDYPNRPIRVIVPYAPGGTDHQIRALGPTFARLLGQSLVIENREGGGATVGTALVKQAKPDGYTLLYTGTGALTVAPNVRKQSYSLDDFAPIGNVIGTPYIIAAGPGAPYKTLTDMIAWAKQHPGQATFGSAGQSTGTHLAGEAMAAAAGIRVLHVPFQGIAPAVTAALGGHVHMALGLPGAIMPQVNAGKLVPLATTGPQKLALLNNIPTLADQGVTFANLSSFGLLAPKDVPEDILQKLSSALAQAVQQPEFLDAARKGFNSPLYLDRQAFRAALVEEDQLYKGMVRELKLIEN